MNDPMNGAVLFALGVAALLSVVVFLTGGRKSKAVRKTLLDRLSECMPLVRGDVSRRRDCIIRLDTLLGKSLEYAGVRGETVGDRLKNARGLFDRDRYNQLWEAHKLRNRLVHEQVEMGSSETERAASVFNYAIRKLLK
ncbi:MAG: hypothetical protein PHG63_03145 [Candidatus Dojkabacteria bacterium]|nr:hypothetical protein [Candidatus Dojkabacteria bacterium]